MFARTGEATHTNGSIFDGEGVVPMMKSKALVRVLTIGVLGGLIALVVWSVRTPVSIPTPPVATASATGKAGLKRGPTKPRDLSARWKRLFKRRFQRPLYDPAPKKKPPPKKIVTPPPPVHLVGTMPDRSGGAAMFQDDQGRMTVVRAGNVVTAGGRTATLEKVHDDRVQLRYDGKLITMKLKVH